MDEEELREFQAGIQSRYTLNPSSPKSLAIVIVTAIVLSTQGVKVIDQREVRIYVTVRHSQHWHRRLGPCTALREPAPAKDETCHVLFVEQ